MRSNKVKKTPEKANKLCFVIDNVSKIKKAVTIKIFVTTSFSICRGSKIRTCDPVVPKQDDT